MALTDASSVPEGTVLNADVCIVGAGAAGLTLALALKGRGLKILVLEAGGSKREPKVQAFYEGEVTGTGHAVPDMYRQRRLGGSTTIWGGRCVPLDAIDFEKRDHVPLSGWPFGRRELDPYYERAQVLFEAGAWDYSAATSLDGSAFIDGFDGGPFSLDSIERFSPPTDFWMRYRSELEGAPDVTVLSHASCLRLNKGENGRVTDMECAGMEGHRFTVEARFVLLAVGGLETVRVLGNSGLGDHSGYLGRTYMCHVESDHGTLRLTPKDRSVHYGFERTRDGVYARRRFTLDPARQKELGILNSMIRLHHPSVVDPSHGHPILSAMFLTKRFIIPEYARKFAVVEREAGATQTQSLGFWLAHLRNIGFGSLELSRFTVDWVRRRYMTYRRIPYVALPSKENTYTLDFNGEQVPNPDSRVTLSNERDRYGLQKLKVDWRLTDLDLATVAATLRELRRTVEGSGCGTVDFNDETLEDDLRQTACAVGGHHIGTARMSEDPSLGVVDADTKVHHTDNLYVASCATFPTSGHANPTLTIVAMALRLAAHIDRRAHVGTA